MADSAAYNMSKAPDATVTSSGGEKSLEAKSTGWLSIGRGPRTAEQQLILKLDIFIM